MNVNEAKEKLVFGLDIGTRSVVGTVGYLKRDRFVVVCQRVKEHETRAMIDGQIHDIKRVAATIEEVKKECEEAVGEELKQVCIAAAGRVLQTLDTHIDMEFEEERETKDEDVTNLMSLGIEKAYREFKPENPELKFYCVGYSVVKYFLNKYPIGNLVGHKAKRIGADIIATFLPDDVVDGLYRSVEMAGLEVTNLTLEPIAAIAVAIPEKFRMLNIALVDVGAGTSDISITSDGSILAYGMIPMAGDCLTEEISQRCLVDFDMAEKIKIESGIKDVVEYEDIIGLPQTISSDDVLGILHDKIDEMTTLVADEIKRLNGDKPVSAVFIVGGGGLVKSYAQTLSEKIGIQKERVALRGKEVMGNIDFLEADANRSSLMVTPIGICLNFYEQNNNLIYVSFNGKRMKLYDNGHVNVLDVAVQAGFPNDGLFPKRGKAITYSVNGKSKIAKGEIGEAAVISVNGKPADITTLVKSNDKVTIVESTAGVRARIKVADLPEMKENLNLTVDGRQVSLERPIFANGKPVTRDYEIMEDDRIEIRDACTTQQIYEAINDSEKEESYYEEASYEGEAVEEDSSFDGSFDENTEEKTVKSEKTGYTTSITITVNNSPVVLSGKKDYVFVDVFDFIDFDLNKPQGSGIVTLHNGENASYMNALSSGDVMEIYWKD